MAFESEKAREQVRRILEYVACPGMACVLDADGRVLASVGDVPGMDVAALGRLHEGSDEHPWVLPTRTEVVTTSEPTARAAWVRALPGSRRLVAVLPSNMLAAAAVRVERAAALLTHMTNGARRPARTASLPS
jgi:hypothetical protein